MVIRPMRDDDIPKIKAMHSESMQKYDIPELTDANLVTACVVVDDSDAPHAVLMARRTAEMYVVIDHEWESPAWRLVALKELVEATKPKMEAQGFTDAYAFLGPDVPKSYLRRLMALGCRLMDWKCVHMLRGEV